MFPVLTPPTAVASGRRAMMARKYSLYKQINPDATWPPLIREHCFSSFDAVNAGRATHETNDLPYKIVLVSFALLVLTDRCEQPGAAG